MNAQYLSLEMEEGIILSGMQSIDTYVQEVATILQWKHIIENMGSMHALESSQA